MNWLTQLSLVVAAVLIGYNELYVGTDSLSDNINAAPVVASGPTVGSGILINDRQVLTGYHIAGLSSFPTKVAFMEDKKPRKASLIIADESTDMAVIQLDEPVSFKPVSFDCKLPELGDKIHVVGNPHAMLWITTHGTVSHTGPLMEWVFLVPEFPDPLAPSFLAEVPIKRGNSGGPALNARGHVIGQVSTSFMDNGIPERPLYYNVSNITSTTYLCDFMDRNHVQYTKAPPSLFQSVKYFFRNTF